MLAQAVMGHVPAFSVEVVDTVAAGDAFNAGLAVALTQGNPCLRLCGLLAQLGP